MKPPRDSAVHQMGNSMAGPGETGRKEVGRPGHRIVIGGGVISAAVRTNRGGMKGGRLVSGGRLELGGPLWNYPQGIAHWCMAGV